MAWLDTLYSAGSPYGSLGVGDLIQQLLGGPRRANAGGFPGGAYDAPAPNLLPPQPPAPAPEPQRSPGIDWGDVFPTSGPYSIVKPGGLAEGLLHSIFPPQKVDPHPGGEYDAGAPPGLEPPQQPAAPALPQGQTVGAPPGAAAPRDPRTIDQLAYGTPAQSAGPQPLSLAPPQPAAAPAAPAAAPGGMPGQGIGNRAMTAFQSWANTPLGNPILGFANLLGSAVSGKRTDPTGVSLENKATTMRAMYMALRQQGMEPMRAAALAEVASKNPKVAEHLFSPPTNVEGAIARGMTVGGSPAGAPGTVPQVDPNMKPPAPGALIPQQAQRAPSPYDFYAKRAEAEARGKARATAMESWPTSVQRAQETFNTVQQLLQDPDLPDILGTFEGRLPALYGKQAKLVALHNQLEGQLFLQAYETLKGGGQITEIEGKKATQAKARLERTQDPQDYKAALREYLYYMKRALNAKADHLGQARPYPDVPTASSAAEAEAGGGAVDYRHYKRAQ